MRNIFLQVLFNFLLLKSFIFISCDNPSSTARHFGNCSGLNFEDCGRKDCDKEEKYVVCYFTNWAWSRRDPVKYTPENINASLCTHIIYAFSSLDATSLLMTPSNPRADIDKQFYKKVTAFKENGLKVLLSIGGWSNSKGTQWSRLMNNATARAAFIKGAIDFLEEYNFDGLDLDYEYPGCPQGNSSVVPSTDKSSLNLLVSELKTAFNKSMLLTAAVTAGKKEITKCYSLTELCQLVDWVNVMSYNYHSYKKGMTGSKAPICGTGSNWGVYETIDYYERVLKCPTNKLVLGIPFYGISYTMVNSSKTGFGVAVSGPGIPGIYTRSAGILAFYEICLSLNEGWKKGFSCVNGSYMWNNTQFVSFDSQEDIIRKSCLINKYFNLKGAMIWALVYDDFNNICGNGSYPLLKTINQQLRCLN